MKRILVAEDSARSRELMQTVLEDCGYEVVNAGNGTEAIAQAERSLPDLILLDLRMPIEDGYAVLQHLRRNARFADTPFVAVTANAMHGERERALAAGFSLYITKPVDLAYLRTQLAALLAQRRP